ncbi:MAG: hypothetical protein ACI83D_000386 [Planctomycetota bacterium]|jgi:hypothetical protein
MYHTYAITQQKNKNLLMDTQKTPDQKKAPPKPDTD